MPDSIGAWDVGQRVLVPLGNKQLVGIIRSEHTEPVADDITLKEVICPLDTFAAVTKEQLLLWEWIASYYMCTVGEVMDAALPKKLQDHTFSLDAKLRKMQSAAQNLADENSKLCTLSQAQQDAYLQIIEQWKKQSVVLLYGVTSSGKTEVYTHLIHHHLQQGKQVLYLVPEIALTTQLTSRLSSVFGTRMAVFHSRISDAQRRDVYKRVLTEQEPLLIVSARSGVFLPLNNLGLVIVDEEHDASYKQEDPAPRYHARSVAIILAQLFHAHVLLGTATPALETWHNAHTGKYGLVCLTQRYQGLALPKMTLIDLNRQYHRKEMYGHLSDPLVDRMKEELSAGKQIILFQNRRGYAPMHVCTQCGQIPRCPNCDVPLTLHLKERLLKCHYCEHTEPLKMTCQHCGGAMKVRGFGTERIEDEVTTYIPEARVARMDWDTTRHKDDYQRLLDSFARHDTDVLIGTQMVTKGLHFNNVSLVAVLSADALFNTPSFRGYERAFQMLEQVAGRAGRTGKQGEIIIQTWDIQHPVFQYLQDHRYDDFMQAQLQERQTFLFPPFRRMINIIVKHTQASLTDEVATTLCQRLQTTFGYRCSNVIVPSLARVQKYFVRHILLRIETAASITYAKQLISKQIQAVQQMKGHRQVRIIADVDPQ